MHTSELLAADQFTYTLNGAAVDRETAFPGYHPQDRVGVVASVYEDGLEACGGALLALTARFYDHLRAAGGGFFTYPQHFCVLAWDGSGVRTRRGHVAASRDDIGTAWCKLDVWPGNRWLAAAADAGSMLRAVFDHQLNRVFWPAGLWPSAGADPALPGFARDILATDLKQVLVYGEADGPMSVAAGSPPAKLVATARGHAPIAMPGAASRDRREETFRPMPVAAFLDALAPAFGEV